MTGKSYKKVRKEDKNKKKLKTALKNVKTKTILPKGQNLTDTNFKVKKIVIKDQVKPHETDEILYHQKLNIAELLGRLNHHNSSVKQEALNGLKELMKYHPTKILGSHYIQVLESVVKLVLADTSSIRKAASKIVGLVLASIPSQNLTPFLASLTSYLSCGLSHIDKGIREDSLILMDACLENVPAICDKHGFSLLSVCLDLISIKNMDSRTLSMNLDSSQVVTKWRIKVLERINAILTCLLNKITNHEQSNEQKSVPQRMFNPGDINYCPIYTVFSMNDENILVNQRDSDNQVDDAPELLYAETIIPLLLAMFLEVHPLEKSSIDNNISIVINDECCKLLSLIVSIMQSLCDIIELNSKPAGSLNRLSAKYSRRLLQTLITGRFPFMLANSGKSSQSEGLITSVNLSVCKLVLTLTKSDNWKSVVPYLKNAFRIVGKFSQTDQESFASSVCKICQEVDFNDHSFFISRVAKISLEGSSAMCSHFFRLLSNIALDRNMKSIWDNQDFKRWLMFLPEKASKKTILPYQMELISQIAVRKFPPFMENLEVNIELILDNIPNVSVRDENKRESMQKQMATLLYWVECDDELLESLQPAIQNCYWGETLTKYICDLIKSKQELF